MKKILLSLVAVCAVMAASGAELRVLNLSGDNWRFPLDSDMGFYFPPGVTVVPLDAATSYQFYPDGVPGDVVVYTVKKSDDGGQYADVDTTSLTSGGGWFEKGVLVGLGFGMFCFVVRVARQLGRQSPEV